MQAIKPFAEILDIGTMDVLKKIELVGRTCYKSTDLITDSSAPKFVENLIKREHEAMLEHASFCFILPYPEWRGLQTIINNLESSLKDHSWTCFLRFTGSRDRNLVSGNVRAWRDFLKVCYKHIGCLPQYMKPFIERNPILFPEYQKGIRYFGRDYIGMLPVHTDDLKSEEEFLTHCDVTVRWIVDRGISHEIVRHRPASFAQESTRYCNYGKDKFGGQITFIIPEFFQYGSPEWCLWKHNMERCERDYLNLIGIGVTPEKARTVLPNSLKTELIMTANCGEWKHFFNLRACNSTGKAHPQMLEVSRPLLDDFKKTISVIFDELTYGE
jgi:thymidylate synthase (FAD)